MTISIPEATVLAAAALGVLFALAIPEPDGRTGQKPPQTGLERGVGSGTNTEGSKSSHALAGVYGASLSVVDGDSLRLDGAAVRLWAVDAPELRQTCLDASGRVWACGEASAASLRGLVERDPVVTCVRKDTDRYGRMVAVCRNGAGEDLGALQVARGLAVAYTRYNLAYVDQEAAAKAERLGMHAGTFTSPETWRRESRR